MAETNNNRENDARVKDLLEVVRKQRKRGKVWQWLSFVFLILFLISAVFGIYEWKKSDKEGTVIPEAKTTRLVTDLAARVTAYNGEAHPLTAEIAEFSGYEYVKLSSASGNGSFWFRNEYPENLTEAEAPLYDAFYLSGDGIAKLPVTKNLSEEDWDMVFPNVKSFSEKTFYVFCEYGDSTEVESINDASEEETFGTTMPETLILISEASGTVKRVSIQDALRSAFSYNFVVAGSGDTVVSLSYKDYNYLFQSSEAGLTAAAEDGTGALDFTKELYLGYNEEGIRFVSSVSSSEGDYYGAFDGTLAVSEEGLSLSDNRFGAYVGLDYEDPDGTKIITPRTDYLTDKVVLNHTNGRYYLPRYEKVGEMSYDLTKLDTTGNFWVMKDENGNVTSEIGIDVSKHKGEIDWEQVADAGVQFAYIRIGFRGCGEGTLEVDEYALQNLREAKANGIKVGVYFYSQAITVEEGIEEANFVLELLDGMTLDYEIVWDTEYYDKEGARGNTTSRALRTEIGKAFCETVKAAGYTPMVYSNTYWSILDIDRDELSDYAFWFAYYGENISYTYDFTVLQYSESGTVPGVDGDCDLDIRFR